MVASSNSTSARRRRSTLTPISSGSSSGAVGASFLLVPVAWKNSRSSICAGEIVPPMSPERVVATLEMPSRTLERSSPVAIRVKVMMSSSLILTSCSARSLVTSATIVQVLPVPALASSTVVPVGSGAAISNPGVSTTIVDHPLQESGRQRPETGLLALPPLLGPRRYAQDLLEPGDSAPCQLLVTITIFLAPAPLVIRGPRRRCGGDRFRAPFIERSPLPDPARPGVRRLQGQRYRFREPSAIDVQYLPQMITRGVRLGSAKGLG